MLDRTTAKAHTAGNGRAARAARRVTVENPATGEEIGHVPELTTDDVRTMVERAQHAQPAWSALGFRERARLMRRLRAWTVRHRGRLIETLVRETGKTYEDALLSELLYVLQALSYWARTAERHLRDERVRPRSPFLLGRRLVVRHEPHGVVGVIAPWNFPLALSVGDAIPALMAGNTVVIKPSTLAPLSVRLLVEEGMRDCGFPEDVCLVATGSGATGSALVEHVDMLIFTGSTAIGREVLARGSQRLIPVVAELGGKDPMIVLRDADLERAVNIAIFWGLANSGQVCQSIERIYVEAPVYDEFVRRVADTVRSLRQGDGAAPGASDVGAMTAPEQIEVVERHVRDAVDKGASVLAGGRRREGPGQFYEPTVLVDVDHSMECMREETFGPTLPIMKVADADEALRLANDSRYGLNAVVFTKDLALGEQLARRVEAGHCCVNDAVASYSAIGAPFGGWKESGVGARHGAEGIRKFCRTQTVMVTRFARSREPYMLPATRRDTRLMERLIVLLYGRGA